MNNSQKHLQIKEKTITNFCLNIVSVFFRIKLSYEPNKVYDEIKGQRKKIDCTKRVCIGSGKHQCNFTIFLDLKVFTRSLYDCSRLLKVAKLKQRIIKDENKRLEDYYPKKKLGHKEILFIMQENFTKEEKGFLLHLKIMLFPLPK